MMTIHDGHAVRLAVLVLHLQPDSTTHLRAPHSGALSHNTAAKKHASATVI